MPWDDLAASFSCLLICSRPHSDWLTVAVALQNGLGVCLEQVVVRSPSADHVAKRMGEEGPPGPNCPAMIVWHLFLVCSSAAASPAASLLAHALTAVIGAAHRPPMPGGGSGDGSGGEAAGRQWSQGVTGGPVWTLEGPVWTRVAAVRRQLCVMCVLLCVC